MGNTKLNLEYIGQDDFSCPTYMDQKGKIWKDINLGHGTPSLYSVSGNELDGEPESLILHRQGDLVRAWLNICPHAGRRLDYAPGQFLKSKDGLLVCEVGEAERALVALLPAPGILTVRPGSI